MYLIFIIYFSLFGYYLAAEYATNSTFKFQKKTHRIITLDILTCMTAGFCLVIFAEIINSTPAGGSSNYFYVNRLFDDYYWSLRRHFLGNFLLGLTFSGIIIILKRAYSR